MRSIDYSNSIRLPRDASASRGTEARRTAAPSRAAQARARAERSRGAERVPEEAEEEARGERAKPRHRVVNAERKAAPVGRREIGNQGLLGAFGKAEVEAIEQKPAEERRDGRAQRETGVDHGIHKPARSRSRHGGQPDRTSSADDRNAAFTTCRADHINGMNCTLPAASVSLRSRNASVELPSVKSVSTKMKRLSGAEAASARAPAGYGRLTVRRTPGAIAARIRLPDEENQHDRDRARNDRQRKKRRY